MCLRSKKDNNGFFISCMGQPECTHVIWLANIIKEVKVSDDNCNRCGANSKKLILKFKSSNILPLLNHANIGDDNSYTSCILCDGNLRTTLDIQESNMRPSPNATNYSNTNNRASTSSNQTSQTNNFIRPSTTNPIRPSTITRPPTNSRPSGFDNPDPNRSRNQSFGNDSDVKCPKCNEPCVK